MCGTVTDGTVYVCVCVCVSQNALDAFRAEEEIASQPVSVKPEDSVGNGAPVTEGVLRQRRRKPPRGNSSFLLRAGDSMMGANDFSLSKLGLKVRRRHMLTRHRTLHNTSA